MGWLAHLKDFLYSTSDAIVTLSDDVGVHDTGGGIQRIHSGVDTQLSDTTGQHSGGVQMGEGGGRGRVSQIVSGHVDGLMKRDIDE